MSTHLLKYSFGIELQSKKMAAFRYNADSDRAKYDSIYSLLCAYTAIKNTGRVVLFNATGDGKFAENKVLANWETPGHQIHSMAAEMRGIIASPEMIKVDVQNNFQGHQHDPTGDPTAFLLPELRREISELAFFCDRQIAWHESGTETLWEK